MKSIKYLNLLVLIVFFLSAGLAPVKLAFAKSPTIKKLVVKDDLVQVEIDGAFTYTVYNPDPFNVAIEFPGVSAGAFAGRISPKAKGITSINVKDGQKGTRVEVLLDSPAAIKPSVETNTFTLGIEPPASSQAPLAQANKNIAQDGKDAAQAGKNPGPPSKGQASAAGQDPADQPATAANATPADHPGTAANATMITGIKFTRDANNVTLVITGNGVIKPGISSLTDRIVIDFYGVTMAAGLPEQTVPPVVAIRSGAYPGKVRLVIDMQKNASYETLASGNTLRIIMPLAAGQPAADQPAAGKTLQVTPAPSGASGPAPRPEQKISLDFEHAQIVPIFMLLGQVGGYNVVVHPSVAGTITLKLKDVPWKQALNILLKTFSLGKKIDGNVMTIAPLSQFEKWAREKEKMKEATQTSEELAQEVIKLNYAAASDVTDYINNAKLLSPRGNITTDKRMNTLIIKDIPSQIDKVKKLVSIIDVAKPQVMIEAQIVEVSSNYTQNLGVRWGGSASFADAGSANPQKFDFSVNTPVATAGPGVTGGSNLGSTSSSSSSSTTSGASPAGAGMFTLGTANSIALNLSIEALEQTEEAKTIANPKVLTIDNESATIMSGQSIPVQTTTAAGTTTQFVNANLNLTVTPRITPNGYVMLQVNASNDNLGTLTPQGYAIDKKNVTTQALVQNGQTLVLGGIFKNSTNTSTSGIPLLSKIPILGWLFKTRQINGPNRDELLILITPRIVQNQ